MQRCGREWHRSNLGTVCHVTGIIKIELKEKGDSCMRKWNDDIILNGREHAIKQIRDLCYDFKDIFTLVVLFGSTARGECDINSDIDLYIESEYLPSGKLLASKEMYNFHSRLWEILGNVEFDLLSYGRNELKSIRGSVLYKQIEKDGIILYDKR